MRAAFNADSIFDVIYDWIGSKQPQKQITSCTNAMRHVAVWMERQVQPAKAHQWGALVSSECKYIITLLICHY